MRKQCCSKVGVGNAVELWLDRMQSLFFFFSFSSPAVVKAISSPMRRHGGHRR